MNKNDGGPAFPRQKDDQHFGELGMSLRNWFRGQALAGVLMSLADRCDDLTAEEFAATVASTATKSPTRCWPSGRSAMRNRDMPATPQEANQFGGSVYAWSGFTKREEAAIAAMQGLLSCSSEQFASLNTASATVGTTFGQTVAAVAINHVDDLFDALEDRDDN